MIQNIAIKRLIPHPKNPRKDLGELSELVESIKVQGVLQNLTVVPIGTMNSITNFTVIIGHRRLAAASLAGLKELPCAIVDMDEKTQIATMLLENMQRADLTVYEQADGIQMMLDLGPSVKEISELTGFSESTVRRRVKLLELDRDKFKKSVERGASLEDFEKLNKISDPERRNDVLESIGTGNFDWALKRAIDDEKADANREIVIAALRLFAEEIENDGTSRPNNWRYERGIMFSSKIRTEDIAKPEDADTVKYHFTTNKYQATLYVERESSPEEIAAAEKQKVISARRERINTIANTAHECRKDFITRYSGVKKHMPFIIDFAVKSYAEPWANFDGEEFAEILGLEINPHDVFSLSQLSEVVSKSPEKTLLVAAYSNLRNNDDDHCEWRDADYKPSPTLDIIYDVLTAIGYELSDEECAWHEGTHELFTQEVELEDDEDDGGDDDGEND